jgi:hypothetical protein
MLGPCQDQVGISLWHRRQHLCRRCNLAVALGSGTPRSFSSPIFLFTLYILLKESGTTYTVDPTVHLHINGAAQAMSVSLPRTMSERSPRHTAAISSARTILFLE